MSTYEQFDRDEKIALELAIVYPHKSASEMLRKFYERGTSKSTLYKYHKRGADKLAQKGFLDIQNRPTELAFQVIPLDFLKKIVANLHYQLIELKSEKNEAEASNWNTTAELRKTKEQIEKLENSLRGITQQLALFKKNRVNSVLETFDFMGIDENWISVLVALNLIEIALRRKAEISGVDPNGKFNETLEQVRKIIKEKEGRELDSRSAFLKETELYSFRSKIVHYGLKKKVSEKEADFIIEQTKQFIEALELPHAAPRF